MFLIRAALFGRDDDDEIDREELLEESVVFCQDKADIEDAKGVAVGEISEDPDEVEVYDLSKKEGLEMAAAAVSVNTAYRPSY